MLECALREERGGGRRESRRHPDRIGSWRRRSSRPRRRTAKKERRRRRHPALPRRASTSRDPAGRAVLAVALAGSPRCLSALSTGRSCSTTPARGESALLRAITPLVRFVTLSTARSTDLRLDYAWAASRRASSPHRPGAARAERRLFSPACARYPRARRALGGGAGSRRPWAGSRRILWRRTVACVSSRSELLVAAFILFPHDRLISPPPARPAAAGALHRTAAALGSKEIASSARRAAPLRLVLLRGRRLPRDAPALAAGRAPRCRSRRARCFLLWRASPPTGLGDYGATAGSARPLHALAVPLHVAACCSTISAFSPCRSARR
jgi:hypothetical protein